MFVFERMFPLANKVTGQEREAIFVSMLQRPIFNRRQVTNLPYTKV
jgi:hypothetical protein